MAENNNDFFKDFHLVPDEEIKKKYPLQIELYERMSWIAEADKAIEMLGLTPLNIYLEMYATSEMAFEDEAKSSHHYICARDCLDDTCPEMILKDCLLDAFRNFKKVMESHAERLTQGKPIRPKEK